MTVQVFSERIEQIQSTMSLHEERLMNFGHLINMLQELDTRRADEMTQLNDKLARLSAGDDIKEMLARVRRTDTALTDVVDEMTRLKESIGEKHAALVANTVTKDVLTNAVGRAERQASELMEDKMSSLHDRLSNELNSITQQLSDLKRANTTLAGQVSKVSEDVPAIGAKCQDVAARSVKAHHENASKIDNMGYRIDSIEQAKATMGSEFQEAVDSLQRRSTAQEETILKLRTTVTTHGDSIKATEQETHQTAAQAQRDIEAVRRTVEASDDKQTKALNILRRRVESIDLQPLEVSLADVRVGLRGVQADVGQLRDDRDELSKTIERVGPSNPKLKNLSRPEPADDSTQSQSQRSSFRSPRDAGSPRRSVRIAETSPEMPDNSSRHQSPVRSTVPPEHSPPEKLVSPMVSGARKDRLRAMYRELERLEREARSYAI
ncbi:Chromosome partition protein Smc [Carpediemonas membranifera]|uniref:Chromosome partition protein Smc n=1 Tax=Carpediemonas membranifera TaxID=201153 RepID=A0A8J6BAI3_9EUKA|nr:Chromosome partition protein Smc [Carpediemonas membranifera]|eukprot:KAG9393342.1 Chromosome partition protein Smc [Carpediemonas membranifera]